MEEHQSFSLRPCGLAGAVMHCTTEMLDLQGGELNQSAPEDLHHLILQAPIM